jgi:DNA (cytosine-5)-methyltransferase 1
MSLPAKIVRTRNEYLSDLDNLLVPKKNSGLTYASVFCGGGGLDLGFSAAGFKPLFSSDVIATFCETIHQNLGKHLVEPHDITNLSGKYVLDKVQAKVDVVIGGPPCQSFSILGDRKSTNDPRGKLAFEYARFIREVNPQSFLFENVPGILTVNQGKDWKALLRFFENETGYHIRWTKLNSVRYGVPQIRQRIIAIGFRDEKEFCWPAPKFAESIEQPELGLREPRQAWLAFDSLEHVENHTLRVHCDRVRDRYSLIPPGGRDRKDHTDRVHPDRPSGTVLVGSGAGGGRPFIHPYEHRHITVREAARLQSFPDWWVFAGGPTASYRQVGNAVPPLMARAIAEQIKKALKT